MGLPAEDLGRPWSMNQANMTRATLIVEPRQVTDGTLTLAASLDDPAGRRHRLWWRVPVEWSDAVTLWADPFVVGLLFPMMQWNRDVWVEGRVSPSLLANLESFMGLWHAWFPRRYRPVRIDAAEEVEAPRPGTPGQAVVPFSCGVDSCFTAYCHRQRLLGRRTRNIAGAVVMHGFDIWLDQDNAEAMYAGVLADAREMLDSLGVPCIPMTSNFHELPTHWSDSHGTHLISGLHLLGGRFDTALIPDSLPFARMVIPWGSHPVSDPLLGSRHFHVRDDGGESSRVEKVAAIAQWPQAMRHLRVCFKNPGRHTNCCRCEKCVRTILAFRVAGVERPPALPHDVTDRQIRRMRLTGPQSIHQWIEIRNDAAAQGVAATRWARAVRTAIRRAQGRRVWKRLTSRFIPWRNRIRTVFRGSPLSQRERAQPVPSAPEPTSTRG